MSGQVTPVDEARPAVRHLVTRFRRRCIGRSRGGLTTNIHLAAGLRCRPVARLASPGQHGDSPYVTALMDAIRIRRRGQGRPRRRPGRAMADKACSCAANRAWLRDHRITAVIPVRDDQKKDRRNRGRAGGRPPAFDAGWYREHNTAGRCCRRRARRGSLGARLLTPADDIESAEGLQLYADPAGHPFCLRWG
ncbi:MAG TPA: transposase [Steroidobacteraceae bacterium]|nr:transposase [Steroidobacteraceae bacterium]